MAGRQEATMEIAMQVPANRLTYAFADMPRRRLAFCNARRPQDPTLKTPSSHRKKTNAIEKPRVRGIVRSTATWRQANFFGHGGGSDGAVADCSRHQAEQLFTASARASW